MKTMLDSLKEEKQLVDKTNQEVNRINTDLHAEIKALKEKHTKLENELYNLTLIIDSLNRRIRTLSKSKAYWKTQGQRMRTQFLIMKDKYYALKQNKK